jgi:hypothetical protein
LPEGGGDPVFSDDPGGTAEGLLADTEGVVVFVDLHVAVNNRVFKSLKVERPNT